jgi:hypothetical protein
MGHSSFWQGSMGAQAADLAGICSFIFMVIVEVDFSSARLFLISVSW